MNIAKALRYTLRCLLCTGALVTATPARAVVPEHTVKNGAVSIKGVGQDNPILYDNDWWFDVLDKDYLWAQASLGHANLRGNIVSRDMWEWQNGYVYRMQDSVEDAGKALKLARDSGLKNIPDLTLGSDRVLLRPDSGRIEDTAPQPTDGSRLIVAEAEKASPEKPLLVFSGGPLSTVANALLTNPEIGPNLVVFNLMVAGGYNGNDAWATYVVAKKTRLVDWATGAFWDKNSIFTATDFEGLPKNPFFDDMREFIKSELGQANQLGDGAALVWLWRNDCWAGAKLRRAVWHGKNVSFVEVKSGEPADVLDIPKKSTRLKASREEFLRVISNSTLFPAGPVERNYYELRLYTVTSDKMDGLLERFRDTVEPVRLKHRISTVGYWVAPSTTLGAMFVYLMASASKDELQKHEKEFGADAQFKEGYAASSKKHGKTVDHISSIPLAVDATAKFDFDSGQKPRAFDLRIYSVLPGKLATFRDRWRDHAVPIYERHGLHSVGWWVAEKKGSDGNDQFICLLAGENIPAIQKSISEFHQDAQWISVEKQTEASGKLRFGVKAYKLTPTDFSPLK